MIREGKHETWLESALFLSFRHEPLGRMEVRPGNTTRERGKDLKALRVQRPTWEVSSTGQT